MSYQMSLPATFVFTFESEAGNYRRDIEVGSYATGAEYVQKAIAWLEEKPGRIAKFYIVGQLRTTTCTPKAVESLQEWQHNMDVFNQYRDRVARDNRTSAQKWLELQGERDLTA